MTLAPATMIVAADPPDASTAIDLEPSAKTTGACEQWFSLAGRTGVRNVTAPTLTPVLPTGQATGAAVIVAAGGAYLMQSMENEAWPQARWLADRGIAAFILKYRLEPTPQADSAFAATLFERFVDAAQPEKQARFQIPPDMVADVQTALSVVRARASEWGVDPGRVGYLGFSAGAMLGLATCRPDHLGERPDFLGAIYPSLAPMAVASAPPPLFVAIAADDPLWNGVDYGLVKGWRSAGVAPELHVYASGGHGFGMGASGTTSQAVMPAFHSWLRCGGWLEKPGMAHD